jgi:hypothetical protein
MVKETSQVANTSAHTFSQRILLVCACIAYVALFQWMYKYYLYPSWDYFGFHFEPVPWHYLLLAWVLSVTPSLWMPVKLTRPSQLTYWVLYIAVFIPSMFVPLYAGLDTPNEISLLMVTLYVGLAIMGFCYRLPLISVRPPSIPTRVFWRWFGGIAATLAAWMLFVFRDHLQFLSFNNIYDLRDIQNDVSEGSLVNYPFMLLTGAFNPFLMGYGLIFRRKWLFIAGVLGQLLIYTVGGTKGSILSIIFIFGFYVLIKVGRQPFGLKLTFGALALVGGFCVSFVLAGYNPVPLQLHWVALFVVLMRTFSLNALMIAWYYNFFHTNPHTFYSNVHGVSWILHYPYQYPVGQEVGLVYAGTLGHDATANFWAADGIGGFGLPGVLFISSLCALVFWALDSAAQRHDPRLAALVTCYAAYNIANISLFTSLFSGGLAILILSLYLMPPEKLGFKEPLSAASGNARPVPPKGAVPIPG